MSEEPETVYEFDVDKWFRENRDSIKEAFEMALDSFLQNGGELDAWINLYLTIADGNAVGVGSDSFELGNYCKEAEETNRSPASENY